MADHRTLQQSLYPDWTPPVIPTWISRMRKSERVSFLSKINLVSDPVLEAQSDGLDQIVPIIVISGKRPQELRAEVGKDVWRKIHHATERTNVYRAQLWHRNNRSASWDWIVKIAPCNLSYMLAVNIDEATTYAARTAKRGQAHDIATLWRDTLNMGLKPKSTWSLGRLKKRTRKTCAENHNGELKLKALGQTLPDRC